MVSTGPKISSTIVLKSGSDLTIPHLECYLISKENDRQFARPVRSNDP